VRHHEPDREVFRKPGIVGALVTRIFKMLTKTILGAGFLALADQAIVSAGNFLMSIFLARALPPAEFGRYVLLFGMLVFANSVQLSVVIYPLLTKGATLSSIKVHKFASNSVILTLAQGIPFGGVIGFLCAKFYDPSVAPWLIGALLMWQIQETVRRVLISQLRYREVIVGDTVSYLGQSCFVYALIMINRLSFQNIFLVLALTSFIGFCIQTYQLKLDKVDLNEIYTLAMDFWKIGQWILLMTLVGFFTVQAFPWLLAVASGLRQAASFQATLSILNFSNPVMFSISNIIMISIARSHKTNSDPHEIRGILVAHALQGMIVLLPCFIILFIFPTGILSLVYGSTSPYVSLGINLRLFSVSYLFIYISIIASAYLGAFERNRSQFFIQLIGAIVACILCFPLISSFGARGAIIAITASSLVKAVVGLRYVAVLSLRGDSDSIISSSIDGRSERVSF